MLKNDLIKNKMRKEVFEKVIVKYVIYSFLWIFMLYIIEASRPQFNFFSMSTFCKCIPFVIAIIMF